MRRLTRRSFLERSALVAGLAGTPWWLPRHLVESLGMRKCLSMGSINHGGDPQDLRYDANLDRVLETGATWVRIWIRWDKAQLYPPEQLPLSQLDSPLNDQVGCGSGCGYSYIQAIDEQIELARAAGLGVVLVTWHFPRWANGTAGLPPDWGREDRGRPDAPLDRLKPFELRFPIGQLGVDGYYGQWLGWLMDRYRPYGRRLVLEIMNEPNHQLWPQQDMAAYVAEMMATAAALGAARGWRIGVGGPALSDRSGADSSLMTSYATAVPAILDGLALAGVGSAPAFVWTHHNYADVEHDIASPTRAEQVIELLRGRWTGRGGATDPRVWLTEGGARLGSGDATSIARQAELVGRSWDRMLATPGIEMFTNYLLYGDPVANSGLRADREAGGAARPVWEVFRSVPETVRVRRPTAP